MVTGLQVTSATFTENGLVVQFIDLPTDVRVKGAVVLQRQLVIDAGHPDYREDIEKLHHRIVRMLSNVLEDFNDSEPWNPEEDDGDEDDMKGMGD